MGESYDKQYWPAIEKLLTAGGEIYAEKTQRLYTSKLFVALWWRVFFCLL